MSKERTNVYSMKQEQAGTAVVTRPAFTGKSTSKRRFKPRRLLLLGVIAWAAYVFFFVQAPDLKRLDQQQASFQQEMTHVQQTNSDLQKRVELLKDPEYIAQLARSKFMMVKDGETLFVEPKQETPKP